MNEKQKYLHNEITLNGILEKHNLWYGLKSHLGRHSSHFYRQALRYTIETFKTL